MGSTGQTGTFQGHALPAAFFFGFGAFLLALSLRRARALPTGGGSTFADCHIPERNATLVRIVGGVLVACTSLGFVYEGLGGYLCCDSFWYEASHMTLYASFLFVGAVTLAEARGRLPPDASRAALALALLLESILWHDHAIMKDDPTDRRVHIIMAQICLAGGAVFAYSVRKPGNVAAYLGGWGMLVLQSLWLITAGINADYRELPRHVVGVLFCVEILLVVSLILLGFVCFGPVLAEAKDDTGDSTNRGGERPGGSERRAYGMLVGEDDADRETGEDDAPAVI